VKIKYWTPFTVGASSSFRQLQLLTQQYAIAQDICCATKGAYIQYGHSRPSFVGFAAPQQLSTEDASTGFEHEQVRVNSRSANVAMVTVSSASFVSEVEMATDEVRPL
jgi:hypothetical protein